jgi:GntR family transcriptional regulator/MocR family aminotransferase
MVRHAPNNNQCAAACSSRSAITIPHPQAARAYRTRWDIMGEALKQFMPDASRVPSFGGTSFWVKGPAHLDSDALEIGGHQGILIEPGHRIRRRLRHATTTGWPFLDRRKED